jgi:peptide/nickel transport system permease protein
MGLVRYLIKRLLAGVIVLLGISAIVFMTIHFLPGGPVEAFFSLVQPTPEQVQQLTEKYGLDKPLPVQYLTWLGLVLRGDLGNSVYGPSVLSMITQRLPATFYLTIAVVLVAIAVGMPLGVLAAVKRNTWIDRLAVSLSMLGTTIPYFFIAIVLILVFSVDLDFLPSSGYAPPLQNAGDFLRHLILPAVSIGLLYAGTISRITRGSMIETLEFDHIEFLHLKGLPHQKVIFPHAVKNAIIPILTVIALSTGQLLGGVVIIEQIFEWPGVGNLLLYSIFRRDYPLIQGVTLVYALIFFMINLVTDVTYAFLNPKIRYD